MLFVLLLYFISFYNLKEYLKAIPDYSRALEFNPEYAWAYWNRGNAYMSLKNFNKKAFGDYYQAGLLLFVLLVSSLPDGGITLYIVLL